MPTAARRPSLTRALVGNFSGAFGLFLVLILVGVALFSDRIAPGDPFAAAGPSLRPPSTRHLMGTDNLGRDLLRGVVHGLQRSMTIVAGVVAISSVIGLVVGGAAGSWRGWRDDLLMRVTEMFQAVPRFFLALMAVAVFGPGTRNLVLLLGLTSWTLLARVVRAQVLTLQERPFVEAARSFGAASPRIMFRHVLPQVAPIALVVIALTASRIVLIESGLAFLGLGDQNQISLGYLASNAQVFFRVSWWMVVFPGTAIALMVLGFNLLSDGLSDAESSRSRARP